MATAVSEKRVRVSDALGLISFILSLIFPLAMIANAVVVFVIDGVTYPLAFFYTVLDFLGCAFVLLALVLAYLAVVSGPTKWGRWGLIVSAASLIFIMIGGVLVLGLMSPGNRVWSSSP